ncbi:hypothetical protein Tco_0815650 [Tanacetum coccineum]
MWFMLCLIDDLGIAYGEGLTIISDQHKGIVEAAKEVMPMAKHRQCARNIYANFRKRFTAKCTFPAQFEEVKQQIKSINGDAHKHLMDRNPQSWSRAFFTTDKACDAVENGINECFNSLIVDARRKPIINMLEDIRTYIMERMKKMRDTHLEWRMNLPKHMKKIEIIKDQHRNGFEAFWINEKNKTSTCRQWQLTGIPCAHRFAAIYFLHKNPYLYVSDRYKTSTFGAVYNHFIIPLTGMLQWPPTNYQKPLPPIARRMPGRPPTKRKRDATEGNDKNRNIVSRVSRIIHCKKCGKEGNNYASCDKRSTAKLLMVQLIKTMDQLLLMEFQYLKAMSSLEKLLSAEATVTGIVNNILYAIVVLGKQSKCLTDCKMPTSPNFSLGIE